MTRNLSGFDYPLAWSIDDVSDRYLGREGANLLIAATALEHGLTVLTRNVRHFEATGVPVLDPSDPRR